MTTLAPTDKPTNRFINKLITGVLPPTAAKDRVLPKMAELRAVADALELATGKDYWPFPTYADLLFGVN